MTYHRAIRILGDKNEVSVSDGVSMLIIYGYFLVGLLVLFFPLGVSSPGGHPV